MHQRRSLRCGWFKNSAKELFNTYLSENLKNIDNWFEDFYGTLTKMFDYYAPLNKKRNVL